MRESYADRVMAQARGRWAGILSSLGIGDRALSGRNVPCPVCQNRSQGGFRFMDRNGDGTWWCSKCNESGAGDGISFVMVHEGLDFKGAVGYVGRLLGEREIEKRELRAVKAVTGRELWSGGKPFATGEPSLYLLRRGITIDLPADLRWSGAVPYHFEDGTVRHYPALLARVTNADGDGVAVHRTYLDVGGASKADVPVGRKLSGAIGEGAAIRLWDMGWDGQLAVAEGIETALSVRQFTGLPVWSMISAGNLEKMVFPAGLRELHIFADNDASFTGQKAAFALAYRARQGGLDVRVAIPSLSGQDFNDYLLARESTTLVYFGS